MLRAGGRLARTVRARRRAVAIAVAAAACTLAGAASASAAPLDGFYGVNAADLFTLPQAQWDTNLAEMAGSGLSAVRTDATWNVIEPTAPAGGQHAYDWTKYDAIVAALARHNLRWDPLLSYSAGWAAQTPGDVTSPPAHDEDYAAFAQAVAARYGRGGSFWQQHPELPAMPAEQYEIWNEENADVFWHPQAGAPAAYADLYEASRAAIRAVDPSAEVLVGGLALANTGVSDPVGFLQGMLAHRPELRQDIDAIAFHPYGADAQAVYSNISGFRAALGSMGLGSRPLAINEVGWTTVNTSDSDRAAALTSLAETLPRSDCGIQELLPYAWITGEYTPSNPEHWFGIVNKDGTPKPSGAAFLGAVSTMRGISGAPAPQGQVNICGSQAAPSAPGKPSSHAASRGPKLRLRAIWNRKRPNRVVVRARCSGGCRLRVDFLARRAHASSTGRQLRFAHRTVRLKSRTRSFRLRVRRSRTRPRRRAVLAAVAVGHSGSSTTRHVSVRLR